MSIHFKRLWPWYFKVSLFLLFPLLLGFLPPPTDHETTCPGPQVSVSSQGSGEVSFSWNAVSGASGYVVYFVREDENYTSFPIFTQNTSIVYSGLPSGRYNFCFATVCGSEYSAIIIVEDLVL